MSSNLNKFVLLPSRHNFSGDSLAGGVVWGLCQGWDMSQCIKAGISTAKLAVEAQTAISPLVGPDTVLSLMNTIEE